MRPLNSLQLIKTLDWITTVVFGELAENDAVVIYFILCAKACFGANEF